MPDSSSAFDMSSPFPSLPLSPPSVNVAPRPNPNTIRPSPVPPSSDDLIAPVFDTPNVNRTKPVKHTKDRLTIATLNIRGGGSSATKYKWENIWQIMRDQKIGILAVQETHLSTELEKDIQNIFGTRFRLLNSATERHTQAQGIAFLLNKHLTRWEEASFQVIIPGRALLLKLPWKNPDHIYILTVYAPNIPSENASFWEQLLDKNLPETHIMLGDFNMVKDAIDRLPSHSDSNRSCTAISDFKSQHNLADGWRSINTHTLKYTFCQTATNTHSRLDRIYIDEGLLPISSKWDFSLPPFNSDHSIVSVELCNINAPFIGNSRWTMPLFITYDDQFLTRIEEEGKRLEEQIKSAHPLEIQSLYQNFKLNIIRLACGFAKRKTPTIDIKLNSLYERLSKVESSTSHEEERAFLVNLVKQDIKKLENIKHQSRRTHQHVCYSLEAESMSKYWINLNKEKKPRETIQALRSPTTLDLLVTRTEDMAMLARDYHFNLQFDGIINLPGETCLDDIRKALPLTPLQIPEKGCESLNSLISPDEVEMNILCLPRLSAAGLDGIPYELWIAIAKRTMIAKKAGLPFFDIVGVFTKLFNSIETSGLTTDSDFSDGWMCPLYKKGDKSNIANYRPITVLNTDYRLMSRILATKLLRAIPDVIQVDQAGFMPGRQITDQTELIRLLLNRCELTEDNGAIISLDQEKAYDKIRHDYLWITLEYFGIPERFTNTLKSLYSKARSLIILNGVKSDFFPLTRGVRQGDPTSCPLFNLAIEPLAELIRSSPFIRKSANLSIAAHLPMLKYVAVTAFHSEV